MDSESDSSESEGHMVASRTFEIHCVFHHLTNNSLTSPKFSSYKLQSFFEHHGSLFLSIRCRLLLLLGIMVSVRNTVRFLYHDPFCLPLTIQVTFQVHASLILIRLPNSLCLLIFSWFIKGMQ